MDNQYLSYLEDDAKLYAIVSDKLPELQHLSAAQLEKLVFYLKSLHGYYPKSENHVAFFAEFSDKLKKLRDDSEQVALQRQVSAALLKGMVCCVFAGVLLAVALAAIMGNQTVIGAGFLGVAVACVLLSDTKLLHKAVLLSKEQDRKYFLSSIRAAKACNELDWAGLFAYSQTSKTEADEARLNAEIGDLTEKLRAALYNDEYFQYSPAKLKD
jgi:hypothetical protein